MSAELFMILSVGVVDAALVVTGRCGFRKFCRLIYGNSGRLVKGCESAGKVTPGRRSKGPPFPAGHLGCNPGRALNQP